MDLTSLIVDTATALSTQRLRAQQSVAVLDKALEAERRLALSLLQGVAPDVFSASGNPASAANLGSQVDLVA